MTETERARRHELIIRDSFRSQQQSIGDWVQVMILLGESQNDIDKMLSSLTQFIDVTRSDVSLGRFRGR